MNRHAKHQEQHQNDKNDKNDMNDSKTRFCTSSSFKTHSQDRNPQPGQPSNMHSTAAWHSTEATDRYPNASTP